VPSRLARLCSSLEPGGWGNDYELAHLSHGLVQLGLVKKKFGPNSMGMPGHIEAYPWRRRCSGKQRNARVFANIRSQYTTVLLLLVAL
jgi:hypothetical protein